jgi:hypothetical protein
MGALSNRLGLASLALVVTLGQAASPPNPVEGDPRSQLIALARQSYRGVRDYSCVLIKREVIDGKPATENVVLMKARSEPYSVHLKWHSPKPLVGQEVCYVTGKNEGMMRVLPCGVLKALGWVSLNPRDPRAMQNNRHAVTDSGIGNLIERLAKHWSEEQSGVNTVIRISEYEYNKRRCTRVEVAHPDKSAGQYYSYRSVVYFDKENHLPIRIENYDWPRMGGSPQGELMESYSYIDLKLNPGLSDEVFTH